jgi:predicted O-methyltransferase YrrM
MERWWQIIQFYWQAQTARQLHAPLAFRFATEVLESSALPFEEAPIQQLRQQLEACDDVVEVTDFGAGSSVHRRPVRRIKDLARSSAGSRQVAARLARCIQEFEVKNVLELGTSLGLTSAYLGAAATGKVTTLEGCPNLSALAQKHHHKLGIQNTEVITGPFRETLPAVLTQMDTLELVYFDGDHRGKELLWQYEHCLAKSTPDTIFVIDDIYWSPDMTRAWEALCQRPEVRLSLDLFTSGYLFFRGEVLTKQHYKLVPMHWKPWQTGIRLRHPNPT